MAGSAVRAAAVVAAALTAGAGVYVVSAPERLTDPQSAAVALSAPADAESGDAPDSASPGDRRRAEPGAGATPKPVSTRDARLSASGMRPGAGSGAVPTAVVVPALGARLPVVPTGVTADAAMELPEDPRRAGWYRFGPGVGTGADGGSGAAVIAAHIDAPGIVGPLADLASVQVGDEVLVETADSTVTYRVTSVDRYDKDVIDLDLLFDRTGPPRLHLVSCGGEFDREVGHYEDNLVAVAVPVGT